MTRGITDHSVQGVLFWVFIVKNIFNEIFAIEVLDYFYYLITGRLKPMFWSRLP